MGQILDNLVDGLTSVDRDVRLASLGKVISTSRRRGDDMYVGRIDNISGKDIVINYLDYVGDEKKLELGRGEGMLIMRDVKDIVERVDWGDNMLHRFESGDVEIERIGERECDYSKVHERVRGDINEFLIGKELVMDEIKRIDVTKFRGEYDFLSNMYPCEIKAKFRGNDITFGSVEAAFQAAKCPERANEFSQLNGYDARKLGRRVQLRDGWIDKRDKFMEYLVEQKFKNPQLADKLCAITGDIVENNTWGDHYWGICEGRGQNKLGKILMNTRDKILEKRREAELSSQAKHDSTDYLSVDEKYGPMSVEAFAQLSDEEKSDRLLAEQEAHEMEI